MLGVAEAHTDAALGRMGITATKTGGGDKEKAYIMRQNTMLRIAVGLLLFVMVGAVVASFTVLEVRVQRAATVKNMFMKRQEQHWEHQDLVRKDLEMQELLREELNDAQVIKDARATLVSLLKKYEVDIGKVLAPHADAHATVMKHQHHFAELVHNLIGSVYSNAMKEAKEAAQKMRSIGKHVRREAQEEKYEQEEFENQLREMGEDGSRYKVTDDHGNTIMPETMMPEDAEASEEQSIEELTEQLKRFWAKADASEKTYSALTERDLADINNFYETEVVPAFESDDPNNINKGKLEELVKTVLSKHSTLPKWEGAEMKAKFPEVTDYIQEIVDEHYRRNAKAELQTLRDEVKSGSKSIVDAIAGLEALQASKFVPLHWMWLDEAQLGFDQHEKYEEEGEPPRDPPS